MKETKSRKGLVLNKETVKTLTGAALAEVGGAAGPQQKTVKVADFSNGPVCTGGIACTFNWSCSCVCNA